MFASWFCRAPAEDSLDKLLHFRGFSCLLRWMGVIEVVFKFFTGRSVQYLAGCLTHSSHHCWHLSVVSLPLRLLPESGREGGHGTQREMAFIDLLVLIDGSFGTQCKPLEIFSK